MSNNENKQIKFDLSDNIENLTLNNDQNNDESIEIRRHLMMNQSNTIQYHEHHININSAYDLNHLIEHQEQHGIDDNGGNRTIMSNGEHLFNFEDQVLTDLIVTSLPNELFTNDKLKNEFESMFKRYILNESDDNNMIKITNDNCGDHNDNCGVKFYYFRILKRCTVKYNNESSALNARYELDNQLFYGQPIRVFFAQPIKLKNSRKFLEPPDNERTFLISPPSSPPIGWESTLEDPPVVNLHLVAALSKLSPHEPYELIESKDNTPGIVLHPCPDTEIDPDDHKPKKFIPTRRPPSDMS